MNKINFKKAVKVIKEHDMYNLSVFSNDYDPENFEDGLTELQTVLNTQDKIYYIKLDGNLLEYTLFNGVDELDYQVNLKTGKVSETFVSKIKVLFNKLYNTKTNTDAHMNIEEVLKLPLEAQMDCYAVVRLFVKEFGVNSFGVKSTDNISVDFNDKNLFIAVFDDSQKSLSITF